MFRPVGAGPANETQQHNHPMKPWKISNPASILQKFLSKAGPTLAIFFLTIAAAAGILEITTSQTDFATAATTAIISISIHLSFGMGRWFERRGTARNSNG